jgi:ribose transport system ATP-binding protein
MTTADGPPPTGPVGTTPAIEASGVARSFGGVVALTDASFDAHFGEIHALVGENGAGKSTMIKVLSGIIQPDEGQLRVNGTALDLANPNAARERGIATVFQELTLMPYMTVAENLLIDDMPRGALGLYQRRAFATRADEVLAEFGVTEIDPLEIAANLSVAQRQLLEIVRALRRKPTILFLDEPTAALARREVEWLFAHIRAARDHGCCVIFTSHRWREVEDIADRITIFRNGTNVATRDSVSEEEAVTLMTGRSIDRMYPAWEAAPAGVAGLQVRDLDGHGVAGVSLDVAQGEIVGIGGLAGQGQRQLFLTLFGAARASGGTVAVGGRPARIRRPMDAIKAGIALVPEDRKSEGLLLPMSVRDNLTLPILGHVSRGGVILRHKERAAVEQMVGDLRIRTSAAAVQSTGTLSGGNQQKVLLGRWLLTKANVLLLYDVTRGVDAGTKHDMYELIVALAREGKSVLLYSSETEEVAHLCHRVLVMREGRITAELTGPVGAEAIVAASLKETAVG